MDRKTIATLVLCAGIVFFWQRFVMVPQAPKPDPAAATSGATTDDRTAAAAAQPAATLGAPAGSDKVAAPAEGTKSAGGPTEVPGGMVGVVKRPEVLTTVDAPGKYHAQLTSYGAALQEFTLLEPRYQEKLHAEDTHIDLVSSKRTPLPFSITFPDSGFALPADEDFTLVAGDDPQQHKYVTTVGQVKIEKAWRFVPGTFEARLDITVENGGDKPLPATMKLLLSGWQDPEVEPSMFKRAQIQTEAVCSTGSIEREGLKGLLKESKVVDGAVRVIALDRKYFVLAAAIAPLGKERCKLSAEKDGRIMAELTTTPEVIAIGGKKTWSITAFAGPKIIDELKAAKVGGPSAQLDAHLGDVVPHGFWGLTEIFEGPMLWILHKVHDGLGNWGLAIIALTMLIKLVTWWPTAQSMKSAQAMAKLKPEMDKLKEKYGDDKAKMNQETMLLYQKHKINPLGGCLPVLIQMPIYIALYSMLGNSVELYRANFGLWIHDLTGPDPYFVLPLLTGAIMFVQQKLSPTAVDPQQKTMMTVMPVMFTGMSAFLPSGLTLYILTNTALSMIQQRISAPPATAALARAATKPASTKPNKKKAD